MAMEQESASPDQAGMAPSNISPVASKLEILASLPERLSDEMLGKVEKLANSPLRPLPPVSREALDERLMMIMTLPKQGTGAVDGALRVESYAILLQHMPLVQIDWMVCEVLKRCEWLPAPAKCLAIAAEWNCNDEPVQARAMAASIARRERQARFDDAMARLAAGEVSQAEIDAMPDRWKEIAETRSLLWRHEDGSYTQRLAHPVEGETPAALQDVQDALAQRFPTSRDAA